MSPPQQLNQSSVMQLEVSRKTDKYSQLKLGYVSDVELVDISCFIRNLKGPFSKLTRNLNVWEMNK